MILRLDRAETTQGGGRANARELPCDQPGHCNKKHAVIRGIMILLCTVLQNSNKEFSI